MWVNKNSVFVLNVFDEASNLRDDAAARSEEGFHREAGGFQGCDGFSVKMCFLSHGVREDRASGGNVPAHHAQKR